MCLSKQLFIVFTKKGINNAPMFNKDGEFTNNTNIWQFNDQWNFKKTMQHWSKFKMFWQKKSFVIHIRKFTKMLFWSTWAAHSNWFHPSSDQLKNTFTNANVFYFSNPLFNKKDLKNGVNSSLVRHFSLIEITLFWITKTLCANPKSYA